MGNQVAQVQLQNAAKKGNIEGVKVILKSIKSNRGAALSDGYPDNVTPLHVAAERGFIHCVNFLLNEGSNLNKLDDFGRSPLYYAASYGHAPVVKGLVDDWGALLTCSYNKKNAYTDEIEHFDKETPFHRAAEKGHTKVLHHLLDAGMDINLKISDGYLLFGHTALHRAAGVGEFDTVRLLYERGCNINLQDDDFNTAIHLAAYRDYLPVVEFLIEKGANLEIKNERKETPRDICRRGNANAVDRYLCSLTPAIMAEFATKLNRENKKKNKDKEAAPTSPEKKRTFRTGQSTLDSPSFAPAPAAVPATAGGGADTGSTGVGSVGAGSVGASNDPVGVGMGMGMGGGVGMGMGVSSKDDAESAPTDDEEGSTSSSGFDRAFRLLRIASMNVSMFGKSEKGEKDKGDKGDKGSVRNVSGGGGSGVGGGSGDQTTDEGDSASIGTPTTPTTPTSRTSLDFLKRGPLSPLGSLSHPSKVAVTAYDLSDEQRGELSVSGRMDGRMDKSLRMLLDVVRRPGGGEDEGEGDGAGDAAAGGGPVVAAGNGAGSAGNGSGNGSSGKGVGAAAAATASAASAAGGGGGAGGGPGSGVAASNGAKLSASSKGASGASSPTGATVAVATAAVAPGAVATTAAVTTAAGGAGGAGADGGKKSVGALKIKQTPHEPSGNGSKSSRDTGSAAAANKSTRSKGSQSARN